MTSSISGVSDSSVLQLHYVGVLTHKVIPVATMLLLAVFLTISGIFSLNNNETTPHGAIVAAIVFFIVLSLLYFAGIIYTFVERNRDRRRQASQRRELQNTHHTHEYAFDASLRCGNSATPFSPVTAEDRAIPYQPLRTGDGSQYERLHRCHKQRSRSYIRGSGTRQNLGCHNPGDDLAIQHDTPRGVPATVDVPSQTTGPRDGPQPDGAVPATEYASRRARNVPSQAQLPVAVAPDTAGSLRLYQQADGGPPLPSQNWT